MKKSDIDKYKQMLLTFKESILENIEHLTQDNLKESMRENSGDLSGYSLHMADVGTDTFDREFALSIAGQENEVLHLIDKALERITDKTYGACEMCNAEISFKRLDALPYARYCINCESEIEKNQG
jgi:DnaK suppressor protein